MSTLEVSNISDKTTSVPAGYVVNGSAKAWVNLNGSGTVAVRDSLNVSSITDNGTGDYTVNFSNNFGGANYCSHVTSDPRPATSNINSSSGFYNTTAGQGNSAFAVGSLRVIVGNLSNFASLTDSDAVCVDSKGDLA